MVHAVGRFRIWRRAVTDPLCAHHVALRLSRLDCGGGLQAEHDCIKMTVAIGVGRVEIDVINAGDFGAGGSGLLGKGTGGEY